MNGSKLNSATKSYGIALAAACVLSAVLVVIKESNEGVMNMMKTVTMHHWVSHIVFIVGVFLILGAVLRKSHGGQGVDVSDERVMNAVEYSILFGAATIAGFFLL